VRHRHAGGGHTRHERWREEEETGTEDGSIGSDDHGVAAEVEARRKGAEHGKGRDSRDDKSNLGSADPLVSVPRAGVLRAESVEFSAISKGCDPNE
jgi:hypothetical protein